MANIPTGFDELSEQYRLPVVKAEGVTDSERYLAKLADKSFLNLWSYPSLYRDQKQSGSGDGKELCDLLVVCGRQIIIFSEKTIAWPNGELDVAWKRWVNRPCLNSRFSRVSGRVRATGLSKARWVGSAESGITRFGQLLKPIPGHQQRPKRRAKRLGGLRQASWRARAVLGPQQQRQIAGRRLDQ